MQVNGAPFIQPNAKAEASSDLLKILGENAKEAEATGSVQEFSALLEEELATSKEVKDEKTEDEKVKNEKVANESVTVLKSPEQLQSMPTDDSAFKNLKNNKEVSVDTLSPDDASKIEPQQERVFSSKFLNDQHKAAKQEGAKVVSEAQPEIQPQAEKVETDRKSIFDIPKQTEGKAQSKVANQELQALLKQGEKPLPLAVSSTVAAKVLSETQTKVNPAENLVDLKQFMEKQPPSVHKRMGEQTYKAQVQRSIFADKFDQAQIPKLDAGLVKSDVMSSTLNHEVAQVERNIELGNQLASKPVAVESGSHLAVASKPVFDLGNVDLGKDSDQVIDQIKNYIIQSKVANNPNVDLSFKHDGLGIVELALRKTEGDQVSLTIGTHSMEGAKFFNKNQGDLLATLSQAGIKISEFKLDNQNSFDSSTKQFANQNQSGHSDGFTNEQRRQHSDRRQQLWELMQEREAA